MKETAGIPKYKIYCAGPLFNTKEKEEMQEIATTLERHNFNVFLPHRDGFEFANLSDVFKNMGISCDDATAILNKAIFVLDVFHVLDSDGLILNMNGRVPDEGAMVEAGIAWNAGKEVVIYKEDARTLINGNDNPLILGLAGFQVVTSIQAIPSEFNKKFSINRTDTACGGRNLNYLYEKGKTIAALTAESDKKFLCAELLKVSESVDTYVQ